ncbi:PAP2 superfamily protein [Natronorubrum sediminis]|uniref:PAP2 superfamily protein n=1 Tax=Natronorubrum sediminis TaxID=640943 RepID=A0A1H6G214_9EURY|nr:phosphatase PAP2 family protein [Natronorubrum sediminis]SEH17089.1 PAP2 superfamily protein [Natronorubrum sediminis]
MSRGIGEFEPIQELVPEWAAVLVALVTQLGDVWFLAILVGTLYWLSADNREDSAIIIGLTIAGLSVITALKHVFALPRPGQPLVALEALPGLIQPVYEGTAMASGYGFPSGHALMTTIVYVSLARRLSIGTSRQRLIGATAIITLVGLSRVALGVHYLVDIVVGIAVGLAFLALLEWVFTRVENGHATITFSVSIVSSGLAVVASSADPDAVLLLGAALGTFGGWQLISFGRALAVAEQPTTAVRPLVLTGGLAACAFALLASALEVFHPLSVPAIGAALGIACGIFVTIPVLRRSERATRVWRALVFWVTMAGLGIRYLLRPTTWRRGYAGGQEYAGRARRWIRARVSE